MRVLAAWIGSADLKAAQSDDGSDLGPIAQTIAQLSVDRICLLANQPKGDIDRYIAWLRKRTDAVIDSRAIFLTSPIAFGEIYVAARDVLVSVIAETPRQTELMLHLSPGTPAMAAVWIILGKTRFNATLLQSSREHGVEVASIPFDLSAELVPDLLHQTDRRLEQLSGGGETPPAFSSIVHRSDTMRRLIRRASRIAVHSIPVLIEGESGTGKELLARAIHAASPRSDKPLIAVNCGAIPSELIESELFGHEKGAFTGATAARIGHFEAADGGTLFLDEIGELPLRAQVKMLRVLQEGEVTRVGSTLGRAIDVRVIAATNRKLISEIEQGRFREDLFYRLAVAILAVPPVRDREGDVGLLTDNSLAQINRVLAELPERSHKNITASARNLLINHAWPGNVRELHNTLMRAAVWSEGDSIRADDLRDALLPLKSSPPTASEDIPLGNGFSINELLASTARRYLDRAMRQAGGNKSQAARLLGLPSYQTLTNWLTRYQIDG